MPRLTDKLAREAPSPASSAHTIRDTEVRGFGLRITPAGAKTWTLRYTTRLGAERSMAFASFPAWSCGQARERAKELRRIVEAGGDPLGDLKQQRSAPTVAELAERYIAEYLPLKRPRTAAESVGLIRQWILPTLGERRVADVTREDIKRLHAQVSARTPVRANHVRATLSMMFKLAVGDWRMRPDNPVKGTPVNREHPRARYLDPDRELPRLVTALVAYRAHDPTNVDLITLLLLTGARRGETMAMSWAQVDLDAGIWTKPPPNTKTNRAHRVPLSAEAVELLRRRLPAARAGRVVALHRDDFVFDGPGKARESALRRCWLGVRGAAELDDVRLHDLRHSFASLLVSSGRSLPEIGALLGHRQAATTQRYSHLFDQPLRAAVAEVGRLVRGSR